MTIISIQKFSVLFSLAAFSVVGAQQTSISPCTVRCENGGICVLGGAAFHPTGANQEEETVEDFHCACQPGWTGETCSTPFASCSVASPCQNNGVCVLGLRDDYNNEQYFCDCSEAADSKGNSYVGKFCEHQAVNYCDGQGDFCVNGECNSEYQDGYGPMCLCKNGHGGPHCEFLKGDVPNCDLQCQHNGHCVLGETSDAPDIYHYWDTSENQQDKMHCRCTEEYDGPLCENRKSDCGSGHCFNGSKCVEKIGTDGKSHFHCDCTAADDITDEFSYAGRFCQYKATTYCPTPQHTEGPIFCVNNGQCKEDVYEGCDCDEPFTGFSCEFRLPSAQQTSEESPPATTTNNSPTDEPNVQDSTSAPPQTEAPHPSVNDDPDYASCDTSCQNGGICRKGAKDLGDLEAVSHDIAQVLNQTSNKDFEHCVCPPMFAGVHCETKMEECGEGEHLCLHGSKCVSNGEYHACDCSKADSDQAEAFAGRSCEHKATNICTKGDLGPGKPLSFCTNSGTCKAMVTSEEPHPGCDCTGNWIGPHCELRVSSEPAEQSNPNSNNAAVSNGEESSSGDGLLVGEIILLMLSLVLLAAIILYGMSVYVQKKKQAAAENVSFIGDQEEPYKDEPNIAPHRDSVTDPFPRRFHSSSSDPFASPFASVVEESESTRQASRAPSPLEPVEIC